jgi:predicted Zn-dependent peptidase
VNEELARLSAVSAADVQRVLKQMLKGKRVTVQYTQSPAAAGQAAQAASATSGAKP